MEKENKIMDTTIYLIRHAQSHPTDELHHSKWPLSELGEKQANILSHLLEPLGIETVYSSPFKRCLQTIKPFVQKTGLEIVVDEDLRERLVIKKLTKDFGEIWSKSWEDFSFALPGCENSFDAQKRFVNAVNEIQKSNTGKTIGISTHGNVIALFLNSIDQTFSIKDADQLKNPDVIRVEVKGNRFQWDRNFRIQELDEMATDHWETPVDSDDLW